MVLEDVDWDVPKHIGEVGVTERVDTRDARVAVHREMHDDKRQRKVLATGYRPRITGGLFGTGRVAGRFIVV